MLQVNKVTADKEWRGLGINGDKTGSGEKILTMKASLADVVEFVQAVPRLPGANDASVTEDASADWDDNSGYKGALRLSEAGWPKGVKQMKDFAVEAGENYETLPAFTYDIAGAFPDVGAFCAGDPEHMALPGEIQGKPVCRILVEVGKAHFVKASSAMRYGVAILGAVNSLMLAGITVVLDGSRSGGCEGTDLWHQWIFPLGGGDQVVDLDRLAFALAHPALTRRIAFAYMERVEELVPYTSGYLSNYGGGLVCGDDYDIHFPRLGDKRDCSSAAKAREKVEGIIKGAGYSND
tara:strand:- start:245 stop:1126 length:882 start_codon:yes stop_codon:yes gene_type:complete